MRYAVRHRCNPDEYLGANLGNFNGHAQYHIVSPDKARLFLRKADATKAARAMGSAHVVPVEVRLIEADAVQVCV